MDFKQRFHHFKSSILLLLASMHYFHSGRLWDSLLLKLAGDSLILNKIDLSSVKQ